MIVAAGLTPAWQHILSFERLELGEVNRARRSRWCASGKVVNAAVAARHLGAEVRLLAPLGGSARDAIIAEMDELGIEGRWIVTRSPTRVCTTLLDDTTQAPTELVENQPPLGDDELAAYLDAYGQSVGPARAAVLTGSLPAGTPATFYRDLLAVTRCPLVLDARGPELLAALEHHPLVIKPNRDELGWTLQRSLSDEAAVREAIAELHARGARWVLITAGSQPAWLASSTEHYRLAPPRVERVVNSIGCGDCLAGALAWSLAEGREVVEAARLAMGAAIDNLGDVLTGRLDVDRVQALAARVTVERVA